MNYRADLHMNAMFCCICTVENYFNSEFIKITNHTFASLQLNNTYNAAINKNEKKNCFLFVLCEAELVLKIRDHII